MDRSIRDKEELLQAIAKLDPMYQMMMQACQYMDFKYINDHEIAFSDNYELRKKQAENTAKTIMSHIE